MNVKSLLILPLFLSACATLPSGPSVMALPGSHKNFEQFQLDDASCRQYALDRIGGNSANNAANDRVAGSAAAGTAIGAVLGAATGGRGGAGFGAATGLLVGNNSSYSKQSQYDNAYIQCMYANGNRVPVSGHIMTQQRVRNVPPPPAGYPPPPPPPTSGTILADPDDVQ
jgi:hypothetical protein